MCAQVFQASPARFRSPSWLLSGHDASVPSATRYGSFVPSAWCNPPFSTSLCDPTHDPRFHACSPIIICYTDPSTWPAASATTAVTSKSVPCTDESGTQKEDRAQILRAELFPSEFFFRPFFASGLLIWLLPSQGRGPLTAPKILCR